MRILTIGVLLCEVGCIGSFCRDHSLVGCSRSERLQSFYGTSLPSGRVWGLVGKF